MMSPKMRCPKCRGEFFRVLDKRNRDGMIYRRRQCKTCNERFTTYEFIITKERSALKLIERFERFEDELRSMRMEIAKDNKHRFLDDVERRIRNGEDYLE